MVKIKIDVEQAMSVGDLLVSTGQSFEDVNRQLQRAVDDLDVWAWDGQSRTDMYPLLGRIYQRSTMVTEELNRLSAMLKYTARRFRHLDRESAHFMEELPWVRWDPDNTYETNLAQLEERWTNMNLEERIVWLRNYYASLCEAWGLPQAKFEVVDLRDPDGYDSRGNFQRGLFKGKLRLDWTNIQAGNEDTSSIFDLMETIAHETRHQRQHYLIQNPDKRPDNISIEQINTWRQNSKPENYIQGKDDFEGYWSQPIEVDARIIGNETAHSYLEGDWGSL